MHPIRKTSLTWLGVAGGLMLAQFAGAQEAAPDAPGTAPPPTEPPAVEAPGAQPPTDTAPPAPGSDASAPSDPSAPPASSAASPGTAPAASDTAPTASEVPPAPAAAESELPAAPAPVPPAAGQQAPPGAAVLPPPAGAWTGPPAVPEDTPGAEETAGDSEKPKKSRWRASRLALEQSLTAQTLGIGQDYQSKNPTYDWTLSLLPRYYFIDRDKWSYSVRASLGLTQELTNSDGTTQRRELDFIDTLAQLRYDRLLYTSGEYSTRLSLGLPELSIPTSKASRNNGRIIGVGAGLIPYQEIPLASGPYFNQLVVSGLARYLHYFSKAQVPTSNDIQQTRTDLGGRSIISDQLSGSPFAKHETRFGFALDLSVHEKVAWAADFQWRPTWNYEVSHDAEICDLLTGCTLVDGVEDPQTFEVITTFATEIEAYAFDEVSFTVGYINLANQIGPDGQRRSMFYSPNARFYLTANFYFGDVIDPGQAPKHVVRSARATPNLFAF